MGKIKVLGSELKDADIEYISLVKHGANRIPFRILKAEDVGVSTMDKVTKSLNSMFGKKESTARIAAVFVRKTEKDRLFPELEKQGFKVSDPEESNDFLVLKQDAFSKEEEGSLIAVSKDLGFMLDKVCKTFEPYRTSDNFNENLMANGFYPGLCNAQEALSATIFEALYKEDSTKASSVSAIKSALSAFSEYVQALATELPETVFKMDQFEGLPKKIDAPKVQSNEIETNPEKPMGVEKQDQIKEAVAGDLAGLNNEVQKSETKVETQTETKAEKPEVEKAETKSTEEAKTETAEGGEVKKETEVSTETPATEQKTETQDPMMQMLSTLNETLKGFGDRLEKVEKASETATEKATEAVEKAENTVIHQSFGYDESLATQNRVAKKDPDGVWDGVLSAFDRR